MSRARALAVLGGALRPLGRALLPLGRALLPGALMLLGGCAPDATPGPELPRDLTLLLPGFDSARVVLTDGVGEALDADGVLVARATLTEWNVVDDFDGDGRLEALAVVTVSGGGSGTFVELVHLGAGPGGEAGEGAAPVWTWLGSVPLGDRVAVRRIERTATGVGLHLTEHGPGDPLCCPTVEVVRSFSVAGGRLGAS